MVCMGNLTDGVFCHQGAASMLGGTTRMTISITVLVMETTGSMQLIIPLMITIFFAKNIGDRYSMGIYDTHIKIRGGECISFLSYGQFD